MLFKGLPSDQVSMLRHCGCVRSLSPGELVFREGDPAYGLYYVISGSVEIFRKSTNGEAILATLNPEEVFGEMGLLSDAGTRTAGARAGAGSGAVVFEIGVNPVELLDRVGSPEGAITIMQNLVAVLGGTLSRKDRPSAPHVRPRGEVGAGLAETSGKALATIKASLPRDLWARLFHHKTLKPGAVLCRSGDAPDGFYFIENGLLHVHKGDGSANDPVIAEVYAPALAGEVGFFAGTPRSATLVAATEVDATHFTAREFRHLRTSHPEDALRVLVAAAQFAVSLIIMREER